MRISAGKQDLEFSRTLLGGYQDAQYLIFWT